MKTNYHAAAAAGSAFDLVERPSRLAALDAAMSASAPWGRRAQRLDQLLQAWQILHGPELGRHAASSPASRVIFARSLHSASRAAAIQPVHLPLARQPDTGVTLEQFVLAISCSLGPKPFRYWYTRTYETDIS
jgi:hypothetical protein